METTDTAVMEGEARKHERALKPVHVYPVCLAIRGFLVLNGCASPSEFYQIYRDYKPTTSYPSIVLHFWRLKELGLIRRVGTAPSGHYFDKVFYECVPERLDHQAWRDPKKFREGRVRTPRSPRKGEDNEVVNEDDENGQGEAG